VVDEELVRRFEKRPKGKYRHKKDAVKNALENLMKEFSRSKGYTEPDWVR
jgi:hypothetical protein